ncbi:MAG: SMP-30/gluconolactonase/LRE family protein, partial [Planctomycetes bacterium]|nr:SMP-30/gluconolactonase/LRE family protein [Planctomycetota bacterium]
LGGERPPSFPPWQGGMNAVLRCTVSECVLATVVCLSVLVVLPGCASSKITADPVYFPPPPAAPHAVHLKSFNRLDELVQVRSSWVDVLRGRVSRPFVETPAGVTYNDQHLYICDTGSNAVHDWSLASGKSRIISSRGGIALAKPVDVAVDSAGTLFVADSERGEVVAFEAGDGGVKRFKPENRDGFRPAAVAVHDARLYVTDLAAHKVDVFEIDTARHIEAIGRLGGPPGTFYFPTGIAVDAEGKLFVADMFNARVQVFDERHDVVLSMGQPGNRYGDMSKPKHVAVGPDGVIFVADSEFARVHLFNQQGQLLMLMGRSDEGPGSTPMPMGVAVASTVPDQIAALVPTGFAARYYVFVTNTVGRKRINLFAVGEAR